MPVVDTLAQSPEKIPPGNADELSSALEQVMSKQGIKHKRLQPGLLAVEAPGRELLFYGMAGPSVTTLASRLCTNPSVLTSFLRSRGIPVRDSISVLQQNSPQAFDFVNRHEGAVEASWEFFPEIASELRSATFGEDWSVFLEDSEGDRGNVVLAETCSEVPIQIAVAYGEAVLSSDGATAEAERLAVAAIESLPHAHYGLVSVAGASPRIWHVDLQYRAWPGDNLPEGFEQVVAAILDGELGSGRDRSLRAT